MKQGKQLKRNNSFANDSGFALFVLPVLFVLFGFFVTAVMSESQSNDFYFEVSTQDGMKDVKKSLAVYAHRNYRVPCPADPSANAANLGNETATGGANNECLTTVGILPFRALGLTEDAAKDQWGNYMTYKVSPNFTRVTTAANFDAIGDAAEPLLVAAAGAENFVHEICRSSDWVETGKASYNKLDGTPEMLASSITANRNIYKARFCCPSNVTGSAGASYTAADIEADQNLNGSAQTSFTFGNDDELTMSVAALDPDSIVVADSHYRRRMETQTRNKMAKADFTYRDETSADGPLEHHRIGPDSSGKFWQVGAVVDVDTSKVSTNTLKVTIADIHGDDIFAPIQVSVDIVDTYVDETTGDKTDYVIDTVDYVLVTGDPPSGAMDLEISLDQIVGDASQDVLYNPTTSVGALAAATNEREERQANRWIRRADNAVDLFNDSKAGFLANLAANGKTVDDVSNMKIGSVTLNATHTSLAFNAISYDDPVSTDNTDLIVMDSAGNPLTQPRNDENSYGSADNAHAGAVTQDFEAPAYVLISHGKDGEGSFDIAASRAAGSFERFNNIDDTAENLLELDNASDSRNAYDARKVSSDRLDGATNRALKYDDIVMWDTQVTLYNALNNGTCGSAQAI